MAQPCTNEGLGDCEDCGPQSPCCTLDVSGVTVDWDSCGGPLPPICGWVPDSTEPSGFRVACWDTPGLFYKFTYTIENTECDFVADPGVMYRWEIAAWPMGSSRTFVRNSASDLRLCCGKVCLPATHPQNTTFPIQGIGGGGGGPNGYLDDGTPINATDPCRNLPVGGVGPRPPSGPTIFFNSPNSITVKHPCRVTEDGVDSIERCTITIVAEEYTPAMHASIINQELFDTPYPPYAMLRARRRLSPCVATNSDIAYVAWPPDGIHCETPSPFTIGSDPTKPAKVLIRVSEPGLCNPLPGNTGPVTNLEIRRLYGDSRGIAVFDCFECNQRPSNILPPP